MKAVSPIISVVLLLAFTVAIGGVLSLWLSSLTTSTTGSVGGAGVSTAQCGGVILEVKEVRFRCPSSQYPVNVTVNYVTGSEPLWNLTVEISDSAGNTNRTTILNKVGAGAIVSNSTNITAAGITVIPNCPYTVVRASAICGNSSTSDGVPRIGECRSSDKCWKQVG